MGTASPHKTWRRENFLISTEPELIPLQTLNHILGSDDVPWATALPEDILREMLRNSLSFGLYDTSPSTSRTAAEPSLESQSQSDREEDETALLIGIARCVTDHTTFLYLTDVFVSPLYQGQGLGTWLVGCVQEVVEGMPWLRRSMLFTGDWERSVPFYEKIMGMRVLNEEKKGVGRRGNGVAVMERKGAGAPGSMR